MTKQQIVETLEKMPRYEREEVLKSIITINQKEELSISVEQVRVLESRMQQLDSSEVETVDGGEAMASLAAKHGIKTSL